MTAFRVSVQIGWSYKDRYTEDELLNTVLQCFWALRGIRGLKMGKDRIPFFCLKIWCQRIFRAVVSICCPIHFFSIWGLASPFVVHSIPFPVHLCGYFSPFAVHFWSVEWIKNGWNMDRKWIWIGVCTVRRILSKTLRASNLLQEKDYSKAKKPSAKAKEFLYASTLHRNFLIQISNNKYANAILLPSKQDPSTSRLGIFELKSVTKIILILLCEIWWKWDVTHAVKSRLTNYAVFNVPFLL